MIPELPLDGTLDITINAALKHRILNMNIIKQWNLRKEKKKLINEGEKKLKKKKSVGKKG